jgi:uncharacterized protein (DUF2235 family)
MPRNIIICFDGTSNEFGKTDTNVVRLVQVLDRDQTQQRLYYDPGVGTLPEPGFVTRVEKKMSDLAGLAFGAGLLWKVQEAYSYLMEIWEPGDQTFVFGFSRGAYSARVFAALLHAFGLMPSGNQNLLPYMIRLFKGSRDERKKSGGFGRWSDLSDSFRWTFARQVTPGDQERRFPVHFVGVWDTVSSVGWIWNPDSFPFTAANPSVQVVRHAVSIDERRFFFRQNLFKAVPGQDLKELWFAGAHCDVGGGYLEQEPGSSTLPRFAGTWRCAFDWMVEEAKEAGLVVDPVRLTQVLNRTPPCLKPWTEAIHDSLVGFWRLAEFVPKPVWNAASRKKTLQCGMGHSRAILPGAQIHESALRRIRETDYAPKALTQRFQETVKNLKPLPNSDSYQP